MKLELRSVRLKNCGPIDDIKIDFFDANDKTLPVCVIAGANGSGKTTVLEAIHGLFCLFTNTPSLLEAKALANPNLYAQADCCLEHVPFSLCCGSPPESFVWTENTINVSQRDERYLHTGNPEIASWRRKLISQRGHLQNGAGPDLPNFIYFPHTRSIESRSGTQISKEQTEYDFV
ncbi:MAG: AAA family ATPase, partial [Blastocatellia bacterium]